MLIVAGLSLNNLKPRVWDPESPYFIPQLKAVMVSYADFHRVPARKKTAVADGLRKMLGIPQGVEIFLDNGAFWFLSGKDTAGKDEEELRKEYEDFVRDARPGWWPVPRDFIPTPNMPAEKQLECFKNTMAVNRAYQGDGFVPVIHVSRFLKDYLVEIQSSEQLSSKPGIALGGIVPNLLRAQKAIPYEEILIGLKQVRDTFTDKKIHVFGIGGTATLHLAALLGFDSVDSSGWRNRAARGLVQLQGSGDRMVADLGSWRGRKPSEEEWKQLGECQCPACQKYGLDGIKASAIDGFCNRATHNLWTLLEEVRLIDEHLKANSYQQWYEEHLDNSTYRPLIKKLLEMLDNQPGT